ncbi:hypothetical protein Dsin_001484 [Dipteronia sinensis]|uniref:Uncharacterized protein n=1 Tax=Dipteronia sinensis TaxID=43782 RepID=A0AAE0B430_9ROSI|nr:hypothetical protein Dsin_001484 [Dipteronia sinensis]
MVGCGYFPMKNMKRKELDLDDVSDDLHEFSLSSPARKIRRLNAQLPPIMEEEKEQEVVCKMSSSSSSPSPVYEEMVSDPVNQERALVLYKPVNSPPLLHSPPNVSVHLDSLNLVSDFKKVFLRGQSRHMRLGEEEEYLNNKNGTANNCLAVIPWVPTQSQFPHNPGMDVSQTEALESMEAEDEEMEMDIEDSSTTVTEQGHVYGYGGMREEGVHQWPQQYCMIPQLPQNTSTPITWFK